MPSNSAFDNLKWSRDTLRQELESLRKRHSQAEFDNGRQVDAEDEANPEELEFETHRSEELLPKMTAYLDKIDSLKSASDEQAREIEVQVKGFVAEAKDIQLERG